MKKVFQLLFHRVVISAILILLQALIFVLMILFFREYFVYFYAICVIVSAFVVLYILNNKSNPAYKIAWVVPILIFPVFGGLFYLIFGQNKLSKRERNSMDAVSKSFSSNGYFMNDNMSELRDENIQAANQARYIQNSAYSPLYNHTETEYLEIGEKKFERIVEELQKAEHFIFLEYFIIHEGKMWDTILDILKEKVSQGVDVRVMYDDFGCLMTLPSNYKKTLESMGIKCCVFNPLIPVLTFRLNNRDHRKICVIDGYTGFTGGINLADEYINEFEKHGHWKDSSIMLKGDAVLSLTAMFLSMWDYCTGIQEDFHRYYPDRYRSITQDHLGYVQPFTDSPLDDEPVGETVYMNIINKAEHYVYITTPYLIISNEMVTALCTAAKCGVDIRIITPHVADKWFVHAVTRAYYESLIESGVKIYEYTPGFIHAKTFVCDDAYAVVGTINLDYRSLYLHFECATWLYKTKSVLDIKEDFMETLKKCEGITMEACKNVKWYIKLMRSILRIFAPLL